MNVNKLRKFKKEFNRGVRKERRENVSFLGLFLLSVSSAISVVFILLLIC
jgi:hypothetical protein